MKKLTVGFLAVLSLFLFTPFVSAQDAALEEDAVVEEESGEEPNLISPMDGEDEETPNLISTEDTEEEGTDWVMLISLGAIGVVMVIVIVALMGGKKK